MKRPFYVIPLVFLLCFAFGCQPKAEEAAPEGPSAGPAQLGFGQQPTTVIAGQFIFPWVTLEILDAAGNLIPTATNPVTLSIQDNPGGGVLSGTVTRSAENGVATFSDLSIDKPGNGYTLKAESGWMTEAVSSSFDVIPSFQSIIVFQSARDGNEEVYVMNADGTGQENLTRHPAEDRRPVWSPGWHQIAFESNRDGDWEIYVMNPDGTDLVNLTRHGARDGNPVWSPDGMRMAFMSERDGNSEVYVMNSDGSGENRLTTHIAEDYGPVWSPDGEKIAFVSSRDGNYEIYVMNADGSNKINISQNEASDYGPLWSPDGGKIAFSSTRDMPSVPGVYLMNADGSEQELVLHLDDEWSYPEEWSPDGSRLLYSRSYEEGNMTFGWLNIGASGGWGYRGQPYWQDYYSPSWSPDGEMIVFVGEKDGGYYPYTEICSIKADGTEEKRLTQNSAADTWPRWRYRYY